MKYSLKIISILTVFALLSAVLVTPAHAYEGRAGEEVTIKKGEVINDDLYISAQTFTLEGTVNGDLFIAAQTATINGTVTGDLFVGAQTVIINGAINDDARIGGAALLVGEGAQIGGDLLAAGASLEVKSGSSVGGDLLVGAAQVVLAGDVTGDVRAGTNALEINGTVGGDVYAYVDASEENKSAPPMNMYLSDVPISIPSVEPGLTVADDAKIGGNLTYSSTNDLPIPSGAVGGKVERVTPAVDEKVVVQPPTASEQVTAWALDMLRRLVTLIILGLLVGWLFPSLLRAFVEKAQSQPLASLGAGLLAWAVFSFAFLVITLATLLSGVVFGSLSLGGLSGTFGWLGILILFALVLGFSLAGLYLTKIIVGNMLGRLILARVNPALVEHKYWPVMVGITVIVLLVGLLSFPLIPISVLGWLLDFALGLLGLGALWLWGRERWQARQTTV